MRVLQVHALYRVRGGEDETLDLDARYLTAAGVAVDQAIARNADLTGNRVGVALSAIWSRGARAAIERAIERQRPDLLHAHNLWPAWSPSVYDAAEAAGVPVVQSLSNYRLLCLNGLFLRDARPCEDCRTLTVKWPGILHKCYRDDRWASAAAAAGTAVHWARRTWSRKVERYIVPGTFAARLFERSGLPAERLSICPPLVADPGEPPPDPRSGALYVGRLDREKGVDILIDAWQGVAAPLTIIGDGPLEAELRRHAPANVSFLGRQPAQVVSRNMSAAALLVFPSLCYEVGPLVAMEALAHGLPILAAAGGVLDDVLTPGETGMFTTAGDVASWRAAAADLLARPQLLRRLGGAARDLYRDSYTPDRVIDRRLAIYRRAIARDAS